MSAARTAAATQSAVSAGEQCQSPDSTGPENSGAAKDSWRTRRSRGNRLCDEEVVENQVIHFAAPECRQGVLRRADDRLLDVEGCVKHHGNARKLTKPTNKLVVARTARRRYALGSCRAVRVRHRRNPGALT